MSEKFDQVGAQAAEFPHRAAERRQADLQGTMTAKRGYLQGDAVAAPQINLLGHLNPSPTHVPYRFLALLPHRTGGLLTETCWSETA